MGSNSTITFKNIMAKLRSSLRLGYAGAALAMLILIALVLLISRVLIIPNAGVLYLLVVIASALWLGTGPALLALLIAVIGIAYFYAPLDADLGVTAVRLIVISAALSVAVLVARLARRGQETAEAERRKFQTVMQNAPVGIAVLRGPEFVFDLVNPAYQSIAPGKELLGKAVAEAWPELVDEIAPVLEGVYRTGQPYHATDVPLPVQRMADAPLAIANFSFSYIPMYSQAGRIDSILVLVIETTEQVFVRKRIEEDRQIAEALAAEAEELAAERGEHLERLEELDRMKDQFLATAAHELKTPVTSLRGFAQTLLREQEKGGAVDPAHLQRGLHVFDRQSQKLAALVNQLLDVTRIEAGRLTLDRQQVELVALVERVVARARLQTATHALTVVAPSALEGFVDPGLCEQVIASLVDNAIRYSPEGGPIEIGVAAHGECARITVRDRGIGVPPEKREHLFRRFYRAHSGEHIAGLGLGLYLSSQIVALHGGKISVDSPPDGGTRFVVTLPLKAG